MTFPGNVWAVARPDPIGDAGVSISTAVQLSRPPGGTGSSGLPIVRATRNGQIRIAYRALISGNTTVRYIEWSGDINQDPVEVGITSENLASLSAFDLDGEDRPGIVYRVGDELRFARNTSGSWQSEVVGTARGASIEVDLTFDAGGAPILFVNGSWMEADGSDLYVVTRGSTGWSSALLDPGSPYGSGVLAGRDGLGQIHVTYAGLVAGRRAVGVPGAWDVNASLPMSRAVIDRPSAMVLGAGGEIHAIFNGSPMEYGYFDGCTWSLQDVDETGPLVGIAAVDGKPHIAYHKMAPSGSTALELWYAHPTQ